MSKAKVKKEEVIAEEIEVNGGIVPVDIKKSMGEVRDYLANTPKGSREVDVAVYDAMNHLERIYSLVKFIESARK
jgi:hypothetical protein